MPILLARMSGKRTSLPTARSAAPLCRSVVIERIWSTPSVSTTGGWNIWPWAWRPKAPPPSRAVVYWIACWTLRHSKQRVTSGTRAPVAWVPTPTSRTPTPSIGSQSLYGGDP